MPLTYIEGLDTAVRQGLYEVLRGHPAPVSRWRSELDALTAVWAHVVGWREPRADRPRVQHATDGQPVPDPHVEAAVREYLALPPQAALWLVMAFVELHPPVQERDSDGDATAVHHEALSARAYARAQRCPPASHLTPGATWAEIVAERTGHAAAEVALAVREARREFRERLERIDLDPLRPRWMLARDATPEPDPVLTLVCGGPKFDDGVRTVCTLTSVTLAPAPRARCSYCGQQVMT